MTTESTALSALSAAFQDRLATRVHVDKKLGFGTRVICALRLLRGYGHPQEPPPNLRVVSSMRDTVGTRLADNVSDLQQRSRNGEEARTSP